MPCHNGRTWRSAWIIISKADPNLLGVVISFVGMDLNDSVLIANQVIQILRGGPSDFGILYRSPGASIHINIQRQDFPLEWSCVIIRHNNNKLEVPTTLLWRYSEIPKMYSAATLLTLITSVIATPLGPNELPTVRFTPYQFVGCRQSENPHSRKSLS
jgi:hypothetical protein